MSEQTDGSQPTPPVDQTAATTAPPQPVAPVDWSAHIPKEYASEKFWEPVKGKGLDTVLKNYAEAQKMIGGSIRLPSEKDKPEEASKKLSDIYTKLGRPEAPDKYDLKTDVGIALDEQALAGFKQTAHKIGLNSKQAQELLDYYGGMIKQALAQRENGVKAGMEQLSEHWGRHTEKNVALSQRALTQLIKEEFPDDAETVLKELEATGLGNNPALVRLFARMGAAMQEDGLITGDDMPVNEEALDDQIRELMGKPEYLDDRHPNHDAIVQKVLRLNEEKWGNPLRSRAVSV
jgi:hypothetical protein